MRIAIIAPTELPARRANTIQVMKMSQAFSSIGHQVNLLAPYNRGTRSTPPDFPWEELARLYGLQHRFPVKWLPARDQLRRYDYGLRAVQEARKMNVELVYTRLPQAAVLAPVLGLDTVLEVHELPQGTVGRRIFRTFLQSRRARRLVVISRALAQDISTQFTLPRTSADNEPFMMILPDGVDLGRYTDLPEPVDARTRLVRLAGEGLVDGKLAGLGTDRLTAGYTGHLYPGRGINLILALAGRLPGITFLLVGGEPGDVVHLQHLVSEHKLINVIATGFIPNQDLPLYQAACDLLLMPYQQQVAGSSGGDISSYLSPMKLFEYLACGRAILSSDLPVLREVLDDTNAVLLPHNDIDAWIDSITSLQEDDSQRQRLSEKARQDARQYSWTVRAEKLLAGLETRSR